MSRVISRKNSKSSNSSWTTPSIFNQSSKPAEQHRKNEDPKQLKSYLPKRISNALQDKKDKSNQQKKKKKKKLKANIAQVKSVSKEALQLEKEAQRVDRMKLLKERNQEVLMAKYQYKKTAKTLHKKHRQEVSAILSEHSNIITSIKAKAKANETATKRKSAETLERLRWVSTVSRNKHKVRFVGAFFVFPLQV